MKTMTCAQMGGPAECTAEIKGSTADEMVQAGMVHVNEAHPEMAETMKTNSPEVKDAWMADFQQKFDAAPEDATEEAPVADEAPEVAPAEEPAA